MAASFRNRAFRYGVIGAFAGLVYALFALVFESRFGAHYEDIHLFLAPVFLGLPAAIIGREENRIRKQALLLDEARKRFSALTHSAIAEREWDVTFHDPSVPNCWEVKNCGSTSCPAYGKEHIRCWLIAGTFCRGEVQGRFAQKLGNCTKCEIYQQTVGLNPINEIGENFNSLMWALREKEDLLSDANAELQKQYDALQQLQKKTKEMADTDVLTGLKNHRHFQQRLQREVSRSRRSGKPLALLMLDLDFFKSVNDEFGHQKGDTVLACLGRLLLQAIRDCDYAARYGGEEFMIIMTDTAGQAAYEAAERLRLELQQVAEDTGLPSAYVGASFGVADMPDCATDAASLIAAADAALLFAKRKGRNRVAYFRDLSETELNENDIRRLNSRLEGASLQTLRALAEAVDSSDDYPGYNVDHIRWVAGKMAHRLGMDDEQADALTLATKLHDIGKVGVPGSVLRKKEKLSPAELSMVKKHPEIGKKILEEAEQFHELISAILYHHERWDGNGYPDRLKGKEIPLMARIVGIIDAYRAMLSDRPYRKALSVTQAVEELERGSGTQFDPALVKIFVELVRKDLQENLRQAG
ncbi:MAG: diguanylate cyclase [Actinobacteria bacterium]|nr:diguanylate cyclase [Actinomycetota bacterium]